MFFVLFAFWLILNGQWTTEIAIVGVVLCGLVYLFLWKFMDYSPAREWACLKRFPKSLAYAGFLVGEIFKSAWQTIRYIWSAKEEVQPEVTSFHTKLATDPCKVVLANSITLTPGTITVDVRGDLFLVHCLDETFAEGLDDSEMEKRILAIEGGAAHE